jgi:hypothetical protein
LLNKEPLREEIYKNVSSLIGFRNYLIHFKPLWDDERRNETLEENLNGLFETSQYVDAGADFLAMHCMSKGCADWCVGMANGFIIDFGKRSEILPNKFSVFR